MTKDVDEGVVITHQKFLDERKKRRPGSASQSARLAKNKNGGRAKPARLVGKAIRTQDSILGRIELLARIEALLGLAFSTARKCSPEQYSRLQQVLTLPLSCAVEPNDEQLELLALVVQTGRICTLEDEFSC